MFVCVTDTLRKCHVKVHWLNIFSVKISAQIQIDFSKFMILLHRLKDLRCEGRQKLPSSESTLRELGSVLILQDIKSGQL